VRFEVNRQSDGKHEIGEKKNLNNFFVFSQKYCFASRNIASFVHKSIAQFFLPPYIISIKKKRKASWEKAKVLREDAQGFENFPPVTIFSIIKSL